VNKKFEEAFKRIEIATGIKTMTELAKITGTSQQYVSKKSREGEFPVAWAYEIEKKFGLLTRWIMTGEGPKRLEDVPQNRRFDMLNEFEEWLSEEVSRNPERKIWFEIHLLDSFQTFAEWKRKRDEKESGEYSDPTRKVA